MMAGHLLSEFRSGALDRAAASLNATGKLAGWQNPAGLTVRLSNKPISQAFHFKNAAARANAQRALEAAKVAAKDPKFNREQVARLLRPFTHRVPIYRGALKPLAARTAAILARQEKANAHHDKP